MKNLLASIAVIVATTAQMALAQTTYQATLAGFNEVPPNGTPGTGLGTVVLNSAQTQITVDLNWSGMIAPATGTKRGQSSLLTQTWIEAGCPPPKLPRLEPGHPASDYSCPACGFWYQLKSQKSRIGESIGAIARLMFLAGLSFFPCLIFKCFTPI
jgi:hypothetical protein